MKKCNNKVSIVKINFLLRASLWIAILPSLLTTSEGSHLPRRYLRSSQSTHPPSETLPPEEAQAPESWTALSTDDETDSPPSASTVSSQISTLQYKLVQQDDQVTDKTSAADKRSNLAEKKFEMTVEGEKYKSIEALCDDKQMTIMGQFLFPFKGRMYAYGYSDETECGITAAYDPQENITFILPLGQCGVQMMTFDNELESDRRHEVTLYIQYSSFLQQIVDEKIAVSCVEIERNPMDDMLQSLDFVEPPSTRQGRRMGVTKDPPTTKAVGQTKISSKIGESWMEILAGKDPSPKSRKMLPVAVGEDVTVVISTKVMRGYDARIVNCSANDGSKIGPLDGYRSQQILDSAGCSVDTALVPNFRRRRLPIESRNRMITLHFATFPAFKFPERDHLHIRCSVAYCQGPCPQEPCDSGMNHFGTWRDKYGRIAEALIDTAEIVNSVEVIAPELDDTGGGHYYERHQSTAPGSYSSGGGSATDISSRQFTDTHGNNGNANNNNGHSAQTQSSSLLPGNNQVPLLQPNFPNSGNVCVSPGSVILALVILGVVLVISATATLWFALKRSEAKKYRQAVKHTPFQHGPQPYYRFSHW